MRKQRDNPNNTQESHADSAVFPAHTGPIQPETAVAPGPLRAHTKSEIRSLERIAGYGVPAMLLVDQDGTPVDGIKRAEIAHVRGEAVQTVVVRTYEPSAVVRYRLNFAGRQLSQTQQALIVCSDEAVLQTVAMLSRRKQDPALAEIAGTSETTVRKARLMLRRDPKAAMDIIDGKLKPTAAYKAMTAAKHQGTTVAIPTGTSAEGDWHASANFRASRLIEAIQEILEEVRRDVLRKRRYGDDSFYGDDLHIKRGGLWNDRYGRASIGAKKTDFDGVRRDLDRLGLDIGIDHVEGLVAQYLAEGTIAIDIAPSEGTTIAVSRPRYDDGDEVAA
jgi:hypothetical protein